MNDIVFSTSCDNHVIPVDCHNFFLEAIMKKNTLRIIVDIVMFLLFTLMFKKAVISLTFHEAGGLAICLVFVFHLIINYKWIINITKRLFSPIIPVRTKLCYAIDFGLLICFFGVLISGIDCSKILFPHFPELCKKATPIHFFFSSIMLILAGMHLGLHWTWIKGILLKKISKPIS